MLCYRCGSHVPDGSETCGACGQKFSSGNLRQASGTFSRKRGAGTAVENAPFKAGELIAGRYEIKSAVGAGPLGFVFRAYDQQVDVEVALKAISPKLVQSPEDRNLFSREIRLGRKLSHNNLVRMYEEGEHGDRPFFTMQFLNGLTMRRIIDLRREKGQNFGLEEVEPLFAQMCAGLDSAHKIGPHGGVKPENVIVLPDLLKLTDFGLALALPRQPYAAAQRQRGGYRYLAPEYVAGQEVDRRADVYSLGVILGEMLAGVFPDGASTPELRSGNPELPAEAEALFRRATHENPLARHGSAGELGAELSALTARFAPKPEPAPRRSPVSATPPALRSSHGPPGTSHPPAQPSPQPKSGSPEPSRPEPSDPGAGKRAPARPAPPVAMAVPAPASQPPPLAPPVEPNLPGGSSRKASSRSGRAARPGGGRTRLIAIALLGIGAGIGAGFLALKLVRQPGSPPPVVGPIKVLTGADGPPTTPPIKPPTPKDQSAEIAVDPAIVRPTTPPPPVARPPQGTDSTTKPPANPSGLKVEQASLTDRPPAKASCPSGMRLIATGTFKMGSAKDDPLMGFDEKTNTSTTVEGFCIDLHEYPNRPGAMPKVSVNFQAAEAACKARGKRLCREEEWERACKGPRGLRFPYGNTFEPDACNTQDANGESRPVAAAGSFAKCRSGFGVSDLSGNVAEWTASRFNAEVEDRTIKGGASDRPDHDTRCATRKNGPPSRQNERLGFRCCADLE